MHDTVSSTHEIAVCDGHLSVHVKSGTSPALVFLHYWGGSHRTFDQVVANLSSDCTIVAFDQRGWGQSRDLRGPYGIDQLADDLLDVVHGLDIGSYVLIGHSMGGKVAQLVASRQPAGLQGVVLVAPAPPRPNVDAETIERRSHAYDNVDTLNGALDHALTHHPLHPDLRRQVFTDSLAADSEATLAWPLQGMTQDITVAARQITVPVLVLAGQHDKVDPADRLTADLLPFIPHARMAIVNETGHLSPLEAPEQLAHEINLFIAGLADSA
jgi:pimeloyl-ACP methyl ester carboxylesterase